VKTKLLIDAMRRDGNGTRYVPMDISQVALEEAAQHLGNYYPWLAIEGLVGDFFTDLGKVPRRGRRLVTFLGSTIGNFPRDVRSRFLEEVRQMLEPGDALLLGVDLVKDVATLLAAYDDAAGVTAEFNKNILHVLNRNLGADFPVDDFVYVARWNPESECVDMGLRATRALTVHLPTLAMTVEFAAGEEVHDEVSCKFRRETIQAELAEAGLEMFAWYRDPEELFAMALAGPAD
jgi:L-histidine N-alpha-methyltransferase